MHAVLEDLAAVDSIYSKDSKFYLMEVRVNEYKLQVLCVC